MSGQRSVERVPKIADDDQHDDRLRLRALRMRLATLVVAVAVPLLALALGAVWQAHRSERARIETRLVEQARAVAGMLDGQMDKAEVYLRAIAASPSLAAGDWPAIDRQARQSTRRGTFLAIFDERGRPLLNPFLPPGAGGLDVDETRAAAIVGRTLAADRPVVSALFPLPQGTGKTPTVAVSLPAATRTGQRVVVALILPSSQFVELLSRQNLPTSWTAAILDPEDVVAASTQDGDRLVGTAAVDPVRQALAGDRAGLVRARAWGDAWATLAVARAPASRLSVVIAIPETVFGQAFLAVLGPVAAIGFSLIAAAVALAMLASRRVLDAVRHDYAVEKNRREQAAAHLGEKQRQLDRSERRFQTIANTMPQIVWSALPDGSVDYVNKRWRQYSGTSPGMTGSGGWWTFVHPDDRERTDARWRLSLDSAQPFEIEYRLLDAGGRYRWFIGRAMAIRDSAGRIERWFGTCTDIHDKKLAEEALVATQEQLRARVDELAQQKARLERLMILAPNLIYINDLKRRRNAYINPQVFEGLGYAAAELTGRPLKALNALIHPDDRRRAREFSRQTRRMADGEMREIEYRLRHADGSYRWFLLRETPFHRDSDGKVTQILGTALDIATRKHADERQQMLIRELHHRVKNILATVQAIASATGRSARDFQSFREVFSERLVSLGRTHSLLTREAWAGADLHDILRGELAPYLDAAERRVAIDGPSFIVPRDMTVPIGMAIHELATNAVKYGALSVPEGRVRVDITAEEGMPDPRLVMVWTESGGPPVKPPERRGFGSLLLDRLLASQLGGRVATEYRPEGVMARIDVVLRRDDMR